MIEAKDITVTAPCLFPDRDPIWMLDTTCKRFGYQFRPYGVGEGPYKGWIDLKVYRLLEEARSCPTSHILYTDARDAWFLAGPEEVAEKYNALGTPSLMLSAQPDIFGTYAKSYEGIPWDLTKRFPYIGTPGMLCEAEALAEALDWMLKRRASGDWGEMEDDDPGWWCNFIKERPGELRLEHNCDIFMNAGSDIAEGMWENVLKFEGSRIFNSLTGSYPCVLHFNGGYSHHLYGKWEQLEPYWRKLGNKENPPWSDPVDAGNMG